MSQRFYTKDGIVMSEIVNKRGDGLRDVTIADAKREGWYASVSTIINEVMGIDPGLVTWKINEYLEAAKGYAELLHEDHERWKNAVKHKAEKKMEKAPKLGSDVHNIFELYFKNFENKAAIGEITLDESLKPYLVAIHKFSEAHKIKPQSIEKVITNSAARTAGRLDMAGEFNGVSSYLDWKTQKVRNNRPKFYFKFPAQLGAYWAGDGSVEGAQLVSVVIDTARHGSYNTTDNLPPIYFNEYKEPKIWADHFLSLSRIYYAMNK